VHLTESEARPSDAIERERERGSTMLVAILNVCGQGWERVRGGEGQGEGGLGGAPWLETVTKAVEKFRDVAGAGSVAVAFCSEATASIQHFLAHAAMESEATSGAAAERGENLTLKFLRCLSMCVRKVLGCVYAF